MNVLELTKAVDVKKLHRMYRNSADQRTAERLRAIYLRAEGKTPREIAEVIGRNVETVRKWIKRFNEGGAAALSYRHSGGRVGKLTVEHERKLARWLREGRPDGVRWTLRSLSERLLEECDVRISQQQISEKVLRLGLKCLTSRPKRRGSAGSPGRRPKKDR